MEITSSLVIGDLFANVRKQRSEIIKPESATHQEVLPNLVYIFYLTTLWEARTVHSRTVGWLVNNELLGMCKGASMV